MAAPHPAEPHPAEPHPEQPHPEQLRPPLTRREQEVAALIARGVHRDRDLAQALTIAETTAGLHVRRILAKLGLHSRWEIAAWRNGAAGERSAPAAAGEVDGERG